MLKRVSIGRDLMLIEKLVLLFKHKVEIIHRTVLGL